MNLKLIYNESRRVAAVMDGAACPVMDAINSAPPNFIKSANGFDALFRRYAVNGRQGLTTALFHEVDKNNGVWEFIKGGLRVLCFVAPDDGSLLVLSHTMLKKQQKTPKSEIDRAIKLLNEYEQEKLLGNINFLHPKEE